MLYIRERVVDFREDSIKYPREEEKSQERPAPATTRSVYSQNSSKSQEGASRGLTSNVESTIRMSNGMLHVHVCISCDWLYNMRSGN